MAKIKLIRDKYAADGKLALLGLSYDADDETLDRFLKKEQIDWPQARMGSDFSRLQAVYGRCRVSRARS